MTAYRASYYIDILLEVARFCLASMISFQAAIAVLFTGIFVTKMLQMFHIAQSIIDAVFLPCAIYFLWTFCISFIDMNIDRRETL